jgi:fatty acid synthase, animal type
MSNQEFSGDEVVISGISGRFPKSNNMSEFEFNLYNKIDMTDDDETKWSHYHPDVPRKMGKIRNLEKFDASFFSILNKNANQMDPQGRILLEHSYEAIIDAGISPQLLRGGRTGVFIACCYSDSRDSYLVDFSTNDGNVLYG